MRIAIVEDEDVVAEKLKEYIERYAEAKRIYIETIRFVDPTMLIEHYKPVYDIIFMDIIMPHINGFVAAQKLREMDEKFLLIFVTNMQNYAVKGYEVSAFDFIVKPIGYNLLKIKMNRALKVLSSRNTEEMISLSLNGIVKVISTRNIIFVDVNGHTLTFHTTDGDFSQRGSIERAENMLGKNFVRCNNCYLVNLAYVKEVLPNMINVGGYALAVSRSKKKFFMDALTNYLGKRI